MELVRISTAGNVDDGKSTLIGRLLYDHGALTHEQQELIERKSREKGWDDLDFSVLTDGLVAEREQGITIDVAHIYFSADNRKFIVADSPGHVEYTRNMVTGASTSDISIILVDARNGLKEQTFRHVYISALLKVKAVVFCINKMDLVGYDEDRYLEIAASIQRMIEKLGTPIPYSVVPISSLKGDNVVHRSENMSWYQGKTLDQLLHSPIEKDRSEAFRFDVQLVQHVQNEEFTDYRAYLGRVVSGKVNVGDRIVALPSGRKATVQEILQFKDKREKAVKNDCVSIILDDQIDISRGALLTNENNLPIAQTTLQAKLVWLNEKTISPGAKLIIKAHSREVAGKLSQINGAIDPTTFEIAREKQLIELNDIVLVELKLSQELFFDNYNENAGNGVFLVIDTTSNATLAVGFVTRETS